VTLRRESSREARLLPLDVQDRAHLKGILEHELKRGGLFLETDLELKRDDAVDVQIVLPNDAAPILGEGMVIHVMDQPKGVGLQLFNIDQVRARFEAALAED